MATARIYTICRETNREFVMRIQAESDYEARMTASRITGRAMWDLTTQMKPASFPADEKAAFWNAVHAEQHGS